MTEKLEISFLLGLYLYLRQLQLSIDRSFNGDWASLIDYFSSRTPVQAVLNKLQTISTIDLNKATVEGVKRPALSKGLLSYVRWHKNYLTDEELIFIYARLKTWALIFSQENVPEQGSLIELRIDLQHAEELVAGRISKSALTGKKFVEHFNQNESLACRGIDELVGESWL